MSEESEIVSRYPILELPEFRSAIPAHLINQLSPSEQHVVETLSKLEQQGAWIATNIVKQSKNQAEIDIRLQQLERWQAQFSVKWMFICSTGLLTLGAVVTALAERFLGAK